MYFPLTARSRLVYFGEILYATKRALSKTVTKVGTEEIRTLDFLKRNLIKRFPVMLQQT